MKILLITKNRALQELLTAKGFHTEHFLPKDITFDFYQNGVYDLLILDSPLKDAQATLERIRSCRSTLPIILLTSKADSTTRTAALNAGADYCLPTASDCSELIACINAILRRTGAKADTLHFGNTTLDAGTGLLSCGEKSVRLSSREFDVMRALFQSGETISSKESLLARVWGYNSGAVDNHVEVYIAFLRRRLEAIDSDITIVTQRRMGYYLKNL